MDSKTFFIPNWAAVPGDVEYIAVDWGGHAFGYTDEPFWNSSNGTWQPREDLATQIVGGFYVKLDKNYSGTIWRRP